MLKEIVILLKKNIGLKGYSYLEAQKLSKEVKITITKKSAAICFFELLKEFKDLVHQEQKYFSNKHVSKNTEKIKVLKSRKTKVEKI
jgi:hypothetical protein